MSYKALASPHYIEEPQLNEYAARLDADLTAVLEGYVLPHRLPDQPIYTKREAQLYVARRNWIVDIPVKVNGSLTYRYERAFHEILWRSELDPKYRKKKLIFLSGSVGCGKSTFVDFYFRCYCPSIPAVRNRYSKKVVLHIDLKGAVNAEEIYARFLEDSHTSLEMKGLLRDEIKETLHLNMPYREKILELLRTIVNKINKNELNEIKHIIICIDNIDQSSVTTQRVALNLVQTLLEERHKITKLKCVFPLWPSTLASFQRHNIIRLQHEEYDEIKLSPPNLHLMLKKRQTVLRRRQLAAGQIDLIQFVKSVDRKIDSSDRVFLQNISYSNIKLMLHTINEMLCSKSIIEYKYHYPHYPVFQDYQFVDALICGRYRTHNQQSSHVLNIFDMSADPQNFFDSLCGLYILYYLSAQVHEEETLIKELGHFGFLPSSIKVILDRFAEFHLIHFDLPYENDRTFHVHYKVVNAYRRLVRQPAALDNFAQTTPIDANFLAGSRPTLGYNEADFCDRVEMTLKFIDFIRTEEMNLDAAILKEFKHEEFIRLRRSIPYIYRKLSYSYFDRLHALHLRNLPRHHRVTGSWWREVLAKAAA